MNKSEFRQKIFNFSDHIYPMAHRILGDRQSAEDAIQEIMMKLWLKRKSVQHHPNLKGLIVMTARNHCIDMLRKRMKVVHVRQEDIQDDTREVHVNNYEWQHLFSTINTILQKVPEQQREVFLMRDIDGYDYNEIAFALNIKPAHCRVLLSRVRKYIAKELETTYQYERGMY